MLTTHLNQVLRSFDQSVMIEKSEYDIVDR